MLTRASYSVAFLMRLFVGFAASFLAAICVETIAVPLGAPRLVQFAVWVVISVPIAIAGTDLLKARWWYRLFENGRAFERVGIKGKTKGDRQE